MANSCNNEIRFIGSDEEIDKVRMLFIQLADKKCRSNEQVAAVFFNQKPQNCFMSIEIWYEGDHLIAAYQTKWIPNFQDSMKIASEIEVSFVHDAFEFNCGIYQRCIYVHGEFLLFPKMDQREFMVYDFDGDITPYDPKDF